MENNDAVYAKRFPLDINHDEPWYTITIKVSKNVIGHGIEFHKNADGKFRETTAHEILGVLEYTKQIMGLKHGGYVQDAVALELKKKENMEKEKQQSEK